MAARAAGTTGGGTDTLSPVVRSPGLPENLDSTSTSSRPMRRALVLVLAPALSGCYVYATPVERATPPRGALVQLSLTDSGAVALASQLGPRTELLRGRLEGDSSGSYVVSVTAVRSRSGQDSDWNGEPVAVPRPFVAHLEVRQFSLARTMVTGVAAATSATLLGVAFGGGGFGTGTGPGKKPTGQ